MQSTPQRNQNKTETRKDRFKRLAAARTSAVLKKLKVLGNCANKAAYEYSPEDVRKVFSAIESRLKETKAKFLDSSTDDEFKL
jgi:hypothetical protein